MAQLGPDELKQLEAVEHIIANLRSDLGRSPETFGSKMAARVASLVGSWKFLLWQASVLVFYMLLQLYLLKSNAFDPYPFILLNLVLSFQAAFTAPIILMAQNRTDMEDRKRADQAYRTIGQIEQLLRVVAALDGVDVESSDMPHIAKKGSEDPAL